MTIERVELLARDLGQSARFYGKILDLPVTIEDDAVTVQAGRSELVLRPAPYAWDGHYHLAFTIPENRLDDARAWLSHRTPLPPDEVFFFERWNAHAFYFADPDSNILEFIARHTLDNASDAPFGADSVRCLSEIGLVVEDVPAIVDQITDALDVAPYHGRSDQFTAVGDAEGLFIVVRAGRIWFGTAGREAQSSLVRVDVRDDVGRARTVTLSPEGLTIE